MSYAVPIILAMLLGFLAGLLSFKVKNRWCPICGAAAGATRRYWWAPVALVRARWAEP